MRVSTLAATAAWMGLFVACGGGSGDPASEDPSMMLTGSESEPLVGANGTLSCNSSKVLICHFPPGNHANEHSICVGPPAWPPHHRLHGDTMGACGTSTGGGGGGGTDAGNPGGNGGGPGGGNGAPDAGSHGSGGGADAGSGSGGSGGGVDAGFE